MKHPLVPVALCYVTGILLGEALPLSLAGALAAGLGMALAALLWDRASAVLLAGAVVLAGAANLTLHTAALSPHDLRELLGERLHWATVRGRLRETPTLRVYEREEQVAWRSVAAVEVQAVALTNGSWQPAFGRVAVSTPGTLPPAFCGGQSVEITGVLAVPPGPLAEGLFDYRRYLLRHGIYYQLKVASPEDWRLAPGAPAAARPWADRFVAWARATLARGLPAEDEPLQLLWAMSLGWRTALTGEVAEPFMRSGTMHLFAISGLHVALIAGLLVTMLRVARLPRRLCGALVIPLLWFYAGATGWQASAIRASVMMTVVIGGWTLPRPSNLLNSLAAAALLILLWEPQQLFQASFQLSFCVVLSLALFAPVLSAFSTGLLHPAPDQSDTGLQARVRQVPFLRWLWRDPWLPEELQPRWQRWLQKPLAWLLGAAGTSLAAWLGSVPLIATYFHLWTPAALLANLLVVPLAGAALASCLGSLATGGWFPACGELFNHSAWLWMTLMIRLSEWAAGLPGAWCYVSAPHWLLLLLYYGGLISLLAGWLARRALRLWIGAGLALVALAWLGQRLYDGRATRITILPLNGGEAVFFSGRHCEGGWLMDCGDRTSVELVTRPFLAAQGQNRLRRLLLTHGDVRHVGGAVPFLEAFHVQEIVASPVRFRSPSYRDVTGRFAASPGRWRQVRRGDQIGPWTVLHPGEGQALPQADDNAVVLRGDFAGTRVLLLSDLGKPGQHALLDSGVDVRAEIVVSGLPTQGEPLADDFLRAVAPRVVVITDADFPATARAGPALRARLRHQPAPVIYTRETGAVTLELRGRRWRLLPMRGPPIHSGQS